MFYRLTTYLVTTLLALFLGAGLFKFSLWPFEADGFIRNYSRSQLYGTSSIDDILEQRFQLNRKWITKLQQGGYILHFRHAHREKWDSMAAFDLLDLLEKNYSSDKSYSQATCLSNQGLEEAKMMKKIIKATNIPIDKVFSSPSCRSVETAKLAFNRVDIIEKALLYPGANQVFHENFLSDSKNDLRQFLLSLKPNPDSNIVLTGHGGTIGTYKDIFTYPAGFSFILNEGGFLIIENKNGSLNVLHSFPDFISFATHAINIDESD